MRYFSTSCLEVRFWSPEGADCDAMWTSKTGADNSRPFEAPPRLHAAVLADQFSCIQPQAMSNTPFDSDNGCFSFLNGVVKD